MNAADDYQFEPSRRDLAHGILKQAALDLRRFHGATSAVEREFYLDAYRWVMSDVFLAIFVLKRLPGAESRAGNRSRGGARRPVDRGVRLLEPTLRTRGAQIPDFS